MYLLRKSEAMSENKKAKTFKRNRKKYKYTKKLIERAKNSGMTQKNIEDMCRVKQSQVSGWLNGKSLAFYDQIWPLIEIFGEITSPAVVYWEIEEEGYCLTAEANSFLELYQQQLNNFRLNIQVPNRQVFKKQLSKDDISTNEKKIGYLKQLNESLKGFKDILSQKKPSFSTYLEFINIIHQSSFLKLVGSKDFRFPELDLNRFIDLAHEKKLRITQVEGVVIFKHNFQIVEEGQSNRIKRFTWQKWIIHEVANNQFAWVIQERKTIKVDREVIAVDAHNEESKWISKILYPVDQQEIIDKVEKYLDTLSKTDCNSFLSKLNNSMNGHRYRDGQSLKRRLNTDKEIVPFLLKKAFIERGYPIENLRKILAIHSDE